MYSRRGSLNLSVNAIVVLILAITMLGLGLTFVRNMFGSATGKLGDVITSADIRNPASAQNTITVPEELTIKRGTTKQLEISFYNTKAGELPDASLYVKSCIFGKDEPSTTENEQKSFTPKISAPAQPAKASQAIGYKALLKVENKYGGVDVEPLTYICVLQIGKFTAKSNTDSTLEIKDADEYDSKQFFMTVVS